MVSEEIYIPRIHVASIETCGCLASFDRVSGKLTVWMTTQAPHAIRTVFSLVSKIPEHKIRVISPDIGGGFGGKAYVWPHTLLAALAAKALNRPVRLQLTRAQMYSMAGHQAATVSLNTEEMLEAIRGNRVKDALEAVLKILRNWDFQPAKITFSGNDVSSPEEEV